MDTVAGSASGTFLAGRGRWRDSVWWLVAVGVAGVAAGVVAVWVTLPADFLRYPAWLAAQKADFVIGPVLTGVYWIRRRPQSPFGPMLIGWGVVGALYILQSSSDSWLFSIGLFWEKVFGLATYVLILAFPRGAWTGRRSSCWPSVSSRCCCWPSPSSLCCLRSARAVRSPAADRCARTTSSPSRRTRPRARPVRVFSYAVLALALAVAAVVIHRFITGTPPRRRALAIGTPVALLFLLCEITYQLLTIAGAEDSELYGIVIWVFVAARAAVWYGFLFALIAAELFAARAMERLLEQSLNHPSKQELEVMLREPLGDPQLRLQFLQDGATEADARASGLEAGPGRDVTVVQRDGARRSPSSTTRSSTTTPSCSTRPALLRCSPPRTPSSTPGGRRRCEISTSRTRLVRAADEERRKVERNLHDGVQHQLIALMIRLGIAADDATVDDATRDRLTRSAATWRTPSRRSARCHMASTRRCCSIEGSSPRCSRSSCDSGTADLDADGVGRYSPEVESAVYYSCLEAIQNATKHGGPDLASP